MGNKKRNKSASELISALFVYHGNMAERLRLQEHPTGNFNTLGVHPAQVIAQQRGDGITDIVR